MMSHGSFPILHCLKEASRRYSMLLKFVCVSQYNSSRGDICQQGKLFLALQLGHTAFF